MASYAKMGPPNGKQMSILAHAKPAIIAANEPEVCHLSDKRLAGSDLSNVAPNEQGGVTTRGFSEHFSARQIVEDELVIEKQNAANQMRQAAVMAAIVASQQQQQQKRLSASERLAMSRPKPIVASTATSTGEQLKTLIAGVQQQQHSRLAPPPPPPPPMHKKQQDTHNRLAHVQQLPTLETLLAVQRQLQKHTRQNLSADCVPQNLVNYKESQSSQRLEVSNVKQQQLQKHSFEAYEKELPPLPDSVSPSICTTTDESQLNSLESQSSPAASLVSLPPPPPPISSYLQQYDEVVSSRHSNNSTPQSQLTASSSSQSSEVCSIKQFPILAIKQHSQQQHSNGAHQKSVSFAPSLSSAETKASQLSPVVPAKDELWAHLKQQASRGQQQQAKPASQALPQQAPPPPCWQPPPTVAQRPPVAPRPQGPFPALPTGRPLVVAGANVDADRQQQQLASANVQISRQEQLSQQESQHQNCIDQQRHHDQHAKGQLERHQQQSSAGQGFVGDNDCKQRQQQHQQINYQRHLFTPSQLSGAAVSQSAASCSSALSAHISPVSSAVLTETQAASQATLDPLIKPPRPADDGRHISSLAASNQQLSGAACLRPAYHHHHHQAPPSTTTASDQVQAFDEPDCGNIRFPSPPPPELLFGIMDEEQLDKKRLLNGSQGDELTTDEEDDDDDDFECSIPTPPAHNTTNLSLAPSFQLAADANKSRARFNSSSFSTASPQPPPLFRQQQQQQRPPPPPPQTGNKLTVHIEDAPPPPPSCGGLLSTAAGNRPSEQAKSSDDETSAANNHHRRIMMSIVGRHAHNDHDHHHGHSSSSPSSSSDGDNHSSNSSSSTSGVHSSIDSPISTSKTKESAARLLGGAGAAAAAAIALASAGGHHDEFDNYKQQLKQQFAVAAANFANNSKAGPLPQPGHHNHAARRLLLGSSSSSSALLTSIRQQPVAHLQWAPAAQAQHSGQLSPSNQEARARTSSALELSSIVHQHLQQQQQQQQQQPQLHQFATSAAAVTNARPPRPALKQKKTVSFSDKIELVACADEQREAHLPNPLLARVLAGKMQ